MSRAPTPASDEFSRVEVHVAQTDRYRFETSYPGTAVRPVTVDEGPPLGGGAGPDPVQALATAVGHCLSATLFNTLERAHVPATPIRTTVSVSFGRNERGRKRVAALEARIECAPLAASDRERFDRCVQIFEEYCTVTGSVRDGVPVRTMVGPAARPASPEAVG